MDVLLVEPAYYSRYPPLGLMKLAAYYRARADEARLVRGQADLDGFDPKVIEVTSLFTYSWKPVHEAIAFYHERFPEAEVRVGGIYASLFPGRIAEAFHYAKVQVGLSERAEGFMPNYDILEGTERWGDGTAR